MNHYEFYVDNQKFYDIQIEETALINPVLNLQDNNAGTLTFTVPYNHPNYNDFKPLTSTIEIYRDGLWFWEGRVIDHTGDFYNEITYTVEGALGYLNDSIQPQAEFHDITPIGYVEQLLNVHNSMVPDNRKIYLGAVTVRDPNNSMYRYTNYNSTLKELKEDVIDDLGGHLRLRKVDGKLYLDILEEFDRTCSQIIRVGENLIDLAPSFDYKNIASVIIPLGATLEDQEEHEEGLEALDKYVEITELNDGKNYLARDDLLDLYDQIWAVVQFSDIHTPQNLLSKAKEYLLDGQWGEMVIEAKAFDLNYTSEEFQEFRLGDRVRVKSDIHGIDRYFPITSQSIHFNDVSQNTITLGGTGDPVSITGVTNRVTINTQKLDERVKDPNRLIQQAIYQATQLINQGLNGYVRVNGNEILIMDTDDPATAKHVWRWNMGGLGYSNNGYEGPFETAITMDGTIVGKFLAANSVAAEQIDVNYTSHVEKQCNDYTDGKLQSYWTYSQTETYFRTLADSIEAGVNTTLKSYVTEQTLKSQLSITESNIKTSVSNTFNEKLEDYSTTKEVKSLIDQEADSITSSVTSTLNNKFKDYSTTTQIQSMIKQSADSITTTLSKYVTDSEFSQLEQKITTDGIFTTINNGLAGSKEITTTKFTMDRNGLEIVNGGIVVKNNSNYTVLESDTSGNLTMRGALECYNTQYSSTITKSSLSVRVNWDSMKFYGNGTQAGYIGGNLTSSGHRVLCIGAVNEMRLGLTDSTTDGNGDHCFLPTSTSPGIEITSSGLNISRINNIYPTSTTVGINGDINLGTGYIFHFTKGILTSVTHP